MPVTFQAYTKSEVAFSSTLAVPIAAGQSLIVAAMSRASNTAHTHTSCTYGGVAMTPLESIFTASTEVSMRLSLYALATPAVGTANVVFTPSVGSDIYIMPVVVSGHDQANMVRDSEIVTGPGAADGIMSVTVGSDTTDAVLAVSATRYSLETPTSPAVLVQTPTEGSGSWALSATRRTGASPSVVMTGTARDNINQPMNYPWAKFAVSIRDGVAVAPTTRVRPVGDITQGPWTASSGAQLAAMLNEAVADDGSFISTNAAGTCEVALGSLVDPASSTGHIVRYRVRSPAGGGDVTIELRQGTTVIASWTHTNLTSTWTAFAQTLTANQADAISAYNDLRIRAIAAA